MQGLRRLAGSLNVVNLILSGALLLVVLFLFLPEVRKSASYSLPDVKRSSAAGEEAESQPAEKSPAQSDYMVVGEKNIFHPERKIPIEKKAEAPLPKPDFILYGTLITDDAVIAYMEDAKAPHTTPGRGKRQMAVAQGDSLSGFVLKRVETDRVTMARGEEVVVVRLEDPSKPKARDGVITAPSSPAGGQAAKAALQQPQQQTAAAQQPAQTSAQVTTTAPRVEATQAQGSGKPKTEKWGKEGGGKKFLRSQQ